MQDGTEFENGLALLGKHYRSSCVFRFSGYKIASLLAGKDLPVYTAASGEIDEVNRLTDMQLGAMLASEWGVHTLDAVYPYSAWYNAVLASRHWFTGTW